MVRFHAEGQYKFVNMAKVAKVIRVAEIDVPKGCNKIYVDIEDGKVLITYESANITGEDFYCKETGRVEEIPGYGDFSVFWNDDQRAFAVCANLDGKLETGIFLASDNCGYTNAIKFRDYKQYLAVKGISDEEV